MSKRIWIEKVRARYDVVVVGGGVIGCAVAYFLAVDPGFRGRVCVIERDPTYARASSSLSASSIRQQFGYALNVDMSAFGVDFLRKAGELLSTDDGPVDVALRERGYLVLTEERGRAQLEMNHVTQRAHGADVALLDPSALSARFPWLSTDGLALGSFGRSGEGWFDAHSLHQAFRRKGASLGVDFIAAEVVSADMSESRLDGVVLRDGRRVPGGVFVNACGPWAGAFARMAGLHLPVHAAKRQVFVFDCASRVDGVPMVFDPSGVWLRPEGAGFICGLAPPPSRDHPDLPLEVDHAQFDDEIWPLLAARVPAFEAIKLRSAWAGYYELNAFDHNAIIGAHPDCANLILANGFSGHGMQHAPAAGRGVAELIVHGAYRTLDLRPYSFDRIAQNQPLPENTTY